MPNKPYAGQWLMKAYHDLSSARILYDVDHFTDTIGLNLQQAFEKTLKAFLAYENKRINKTHNLIEIYELVSEHLQLDESDIKLLGIATNYFTHERYPTVNAELPSRDEIKVMLVFAEEMFEKVCSMLEISVEGRSN
jgi:HEPN domain-containing protein